jgi:hypothetical protein
VDQTVADMMPGEDEIQQRLHYLELTADDVALLRHIHPLLQPRLPAVIAAFYRHLLEIPVLQALLSDPVVLDRLHHLQGAYFKTLTAGEYGRDYVRHRLRVGLAHAAHRPGAGVVHRRLSQISGRPGAGAARHPARPPCAVHLYLQCLDEGGQL